MDEEAVEQNNACKNPANRSITTVEELRIALEKMGLSTKGHKAELKRRYRKASKKQKEKEDDVKTTVAYRDTSEATNVSEKAITEATVNMMEEATTIENLIESKASDKKKQPFDYYLFFDVEATCEENGGFTYPNEIIEFPVVLVDGSTFDIVDEFRSYVKPTRNPILSDFCIKLTGIQQSTVDESPTFVEVLDLFQEFMAKYGLFQTKSATFVTDGPFDIRDFITKQCKHSKLKKRPAYFDIPWVNIRQSFKRFYKQTENKNISMMLSYLNMKFEGREHSGLDDARNLVAIGKRMHEEGCIFKPNCNYSFRNNQVYYQTNKQKRRR
ncbi:ribonuclease H-like domain-containing protein [Mycotypha africana]|uniref:ribonuclease H-like domain-containing protein n=1 Tax=Mycotypha africana TaxID=64632 RepID=UPI002300F5CA|nr:ribonuclease H-like domain-containing protein [Mycotypha africana]KAI8991457.1 ribonuclease H-like domain-containing protein [Mycotypha africana]